MKEPSQAGNNKNSAFDQLLMVTVVISAVLILTIASLVAVSVISRYILGKPMAWVIEISEYLLLWSTFVAAAWVLKEDGHIKIDLVINHFPAFLKNSVESATQLLGLCLFVTITFYGFAEVQSVYERGIAAVGMFRVPKYLLLLSVPFGSLLLIGQYFRLIRSRFGRRYMQKKVKMLNGLL